MTLREWLSREGRSITSLADATGLHYTTIIAAVYGKPLGRRAARLVHNETGVPLDALLIGDPDNPSGRKKTSRYADEAQREASR